MNKPENRDVYLQRIKRKINSWDGLVIDYLSKHPSRKAATELSMDAVASYWLAEALEDKVSQEELIKACWSAIEKLEGKIVTIKRIGGIDRLPTPISSLSTNVATSNNMTNMTKDEPHISSHTEIEDEELEDDWELMDIPQPEEVKDANDLLGLKN